MKRNIVVILGAFLIILFITVPLVYGLNVLSSIPKLRIHSLRLSAIRDGWDIHVFLSFIVENPTDNIVPTISLLCECKIDDNILFYAEQSTIESLNPHSSVTVTLKTIVNMDLALDLFQSLLRYLLGEPVSYFLHINFVVHFFLFDYTVWEVKRVGEFELY